MAETEAANHQEINGSENKGGNYDILLIFVLWEIEGRIWDKVFKNGPSKIF